MDVCLLWVLCVVRWRSLRRAGHSSRGILLTVVRRCVWFRNFVNEEALAQRGAVAPKNKQQKWTEEHRLHFFDISLMMRLFEPKRKKVIKAGENCIIPVCSFVICSITQFYYGVGTKIMRADEFTVQSGIIFPLFFIIYYFETKTR